MPIEKVVEVIKEVKTTDVHLIEEHSALKIAYDNLLNDLKQQIKINETLRTSIIELENIIDYYNLNTKNSDSDLKHQLQYLVKNNAKNIEYKSQKNIVKRAEGEIQNLRNKIDRMENQHLNNSLVFDSTPDILKASTKVDNKPLNTNSSLSIVSGGRPQPAPLNDYNFQGLFPNKNNIPITQTTEKYGDLYNSLGYSVPTNHSSSSVLGNLSQSGNYITNNPKPKKAYEYYSNNN